MGKKIDPSDVEWRARYRVEHSPRLRQYAEIIFQDWDEYDAHLRWVVRGRVSEIESWAKSIAHGITKGEGE
jgi:hypothetical protein